MDFRFQWNPDKERLNAAKHGVSFSEAATVFNDPRQLSCFDDEHSQDGDRWITFGISAKGRVLAVCHTFHESPGETSIRIFSSRRATRREQAQYEAKS